MQTILVIVKQNNTNTMWVLSISTSQAEIGDYQWQLNLIANNLFKLIDISINLLHLIATSIILVLLYFMHI